MLIGSNLANTMYLLSYCTNGQNSWPNNTSIQSIAIEKIKNNPNYVTYD